MTAHLIDGNALAATLRKDLRDRIAARIANGLRAPGLAVILVGTDPRPRFTSATSAVPVETPAWYPARSTCRPTSPSRHCLI